ncbi:MAG: penicillin-binding protein 2, partial [Eubacteriales bacterium]|nr:penicillin-binding protein 2 [Eubacteriales bacterium]
LGYLGTLSAEELTLEENVGLTTDTLVGKSGLERTYESKMRGTPGYELAIVDAYGRRKATVATVEKNDGSDLRLTVDIKLQQKAELLMMEHLTDQMAGSVVVMDPSTGYIEALASYPSYDPNQFSFQMDESTWAYLNDPANMLPLYNRCTQGLYPPGSTIKPFTGIMGLEAGSISTGFAFSEEINRNIWVPTMDGWVYPGIKRVSATPGALNLENALIYSDNIYFAYVALKLGSEKFMQYAARLGFGSPMDFDLPLGVSKIANDDVMTSLRLLADSGYGQGELLITPVQMAALFGTLYTDGDMMQPRLVQSICKTNGPHYDVVQENPPEIWREQVVPKNLVEIVRPMLRRVVGQSSGTGHKVEVSGLGICGKTGTAQIGNDSTREIAWFIGFTTAWDHPRLVCVMLEIPAGEGQARFDIAKALFEDLKESYPPADQNAGQGGEQ